MADRSDDLLWNLDRHATGTCWRRVALFAAVSMTAVGGVHLLAMALGPQVPLGLAIALLTVFALSFSWISLSFWAGILGFLLKALQLHPLSLTRHGPGEGEIPQLRGRTAILVPVYNEKPDEVLARLATTWRSLEATGRGRAFSLFVLSDTTVDSIAAEEEKGIETLRQRLGIGDRLNWRRRAANKGRKAGNIADWLDSHGHRFDHMIAVSYTHLTLPTN